MSSFTITTPETNIHLRPSSVKKGATATGNVTYSVTNTSGGTRRTRLRIDAGDDVHPDWVSVRDGDERDIPPGATETFSVDINAPGSEAPQNLSFTGVAVNLEDPDNDFERGSAVGFAMPAITVVKPIAWWKIAVPIAVVLLLAGGLTTFLLTRDKGEPFELASVVNEPLEIARASLEEQALKVSEEFVGETEEQDPEEGWVKIVKEQDPAAGEEVKKNKKITLGWDWVSNAVAVADWSAKPLDQAVTALETAGFTVTEVSGALVSPEISQEQFYTRVVASQKPESDGTLELPTSTPIELTWKWQPKKVTVPTNLVGKRADIASQQLDAAGLRVIGIVPPPGNPPNPANEHAPRVASLSRSGQVDAGTGVTLTMKWSKVCTAANRLVCIRQVQDFGILQERINSGVFTGVFQDNN